MSSGSTKLPHLNLNVDGILLKADTAGETLTYASMVRGVGYVTNGESLILLQHRGYLGMKLKDWKVIHEELGYMIEEAERWGKS